MIIRQHEHNHYHSYQQHHKQFDINTPNTPVGTELSVSQNIYPDS